MNSSTKYFDYLLDSIPSIFLTVTLTLSVTPTHCAHWTKIQRKKLFIFHTFDVPHMSTYPSLFRRWCSNLSDQCFYFLFFFVCFPVNFPANLRTSSIWLDNIFNLSYCCCCYSCCCCCYCHTAIFFLFERFEFFSVNTFTCDCSCHLFELLRLMTTTTVTTNNNILTVRNDQQVSRRSDVQLVQLLKFYRTNNEHDNNDTTTNFPLLIFRSRLLPVGCARRCCCCLTTEVDRHY